MRLGNSVKDLIENDWKAFSGWKMDPRTISFQRIANNVSIVVIYCLYDYLLFLARLVTDDSKYSWNIEGIVISGRHSHIILLRERRVLSGKGQFW